MGARQASATSATRLQDLQRKFKKKMKQQGEKSESFFSVARGHFGYASSVPTAALVT